MLCTAKANELLEQYFSKVVYSVKNGALNSERKYFYIGLHTAANGKTPQPDGSDFDEPALPEGITDEDGNPITENEYRRVKVHSTENGKKLSDAVEGIIKNIQAIMFEEATHYGWGNITHLGIFEEETGGNPIFWGELKQAKEIPAGYIAVFRKNKMMIGLDRDPAEVTV